MEKTTELKVVLKEKGFLIYQLPLAEAEKIKQAFDNVHAESFIIGEDEIPADYIQGILIGRC